MTENPIPPGNSDFPPSAPMPSAGAPPNPYAYPPGPPGPYPGGPYPGGPYQGDPYQGGPYPGGGYPPPPMSYGDYYQGPPTAPKNGLGVAALVIAIIALVLSFTIIGGIIGGITAVILGIIGRGRAKRREADNGGVALAGIILGVVSIVASLAFVPIYVGMFKESGFGDYLNCVQQAGQNSNAVQQCSLEFRQSMSEKFPSTPTPTR